MYDLYILYNSKSYRVNLMDFRYVMRLTFLDRTLISLLRRHLVLPPGLVVAKKNKRYRIYDNASVPT